LILVIDTSSARSALAVLTPAGETVAEEIFPLPLQGEGRVGVPSGRKHFPTDDLPAKAMVTIAGHRLTRVAMAIGPGSFTGLRVGVSFGLGLAIGLRVPIVPLRSLEIQAARSEGPVLAVTEAGRGRVYHLAPGAEPGLAEPGDLPKELPVVGWLRPDTEQALAAAGLHLTADAELKSFGDAAARCLRSAREVAYGSLRLEYMQSFSARA
jgi:tRNA threonylcarbamoyl adenosine modification protein YeaZ